MSYQLHFTDKAVDDIKSYKKSGNKALLNKLLKLLEEITDHPFTDHPFTGTGKPEALKHELTGCWSRRINKEHRLVYEVSENEIFILSVKGHY